MNPYEFPGWPRADYIPPVFFYHFRSPVSYTHLTLPTKLEV